MVFSSIDLLISKEIKEVYEINKIILIFLWRTTISVKQQLTNE